MGTHADGFNCNCSTCNKFYKKLTRTPRVDADLRLSPRYQSATSQTVDSVEHNHQDHRDFPPKCNSKHWIKIGDRVTVHDKFKGIAKFIGPLDVDLITPDIYVGIKLDEPVTGMHCGIVNGKRYFHAPLGCGLMVKYDEVARVKPPDRKPPLHGNYMYPSYNKSHKRRSDSPQNKNNSEMSSSHTPSSITKNRKPVRKSNRQQTMEKEYKKQTFTSQQKVPPVDPLPRRLRQEASHWKQNTSTEQAEIMKATLTKLYLAQEKGKEEMQDARSAQEEGEAERMDQYKQRNQTRDTFIESRLGRCLRKCRVNSSTHLKLCI